MMQLPSGSPRISYYQNTTVTESLQGQRVLFVAPRFFGYEQDLAAELRRRGAEVDVLHDRPFDTPFFKAVTRFGPDLVLGAASRLYRRKLTEYGRTNYNLILVVNGQTVSESILKELRTSYPHARFVLYMWDSFHNRRRAVHNLRYFDDCLSFDPDCARDYGLRFRPLFFSSSFECPTRGDNFEYHLSFIGTVHTDRFEIVRRIAAGLPPHLRFFRYLYLQAPWVYYGLRLVNPHFRGARREDFKFASLDRQAVRAVFFGSRAILDIEHPRQTGLTIRTLETVGASRKLVTTNTRVREYDFYRPENVCIIRRDAAKVPEDFLEQPYSPLAPVLYHRYSIAGWMDEVLMNVAQRKEYQK